MPLFYLLLITVVMFGTFVASVVMANWNNSICRLLGLLNLLTMSTSQMLCNLNTSPMTCVPALDKLSAKISANMLTDTRPTDVE